MRTEGSGSIPASIREQTKFEKKAILNSQFSSLNSSLHAWLKRVSPGMIWDWRHQLHIIDQLEKVTTGEYKRLMIFLPPRHGKSELVTVRYSAWRMQHDPSMNIILGSYNQRLADRFSRKVRKVIIDAEAIENGASVDNGKLTMDNAGAAAFPPNRRHSNKANAEADQQTAREPAKQETIVNSPLSNVLSRSMFPFASSKPANSVSEWETAAGGGFRSVGVGGGVTGFGAQLIVIDDPVKSRAEAESETYRENVWEWFNDDLYTRLEPNGAMILIQTRWHDDDLAGRLLREMHEGGEQWDVIDLPALAERNGDTLVPTDASASDTCSDFQAASGLVDKSVHTPLDPLGRVPGEALCPERFDVPTLEKIKQTLGTYSFSALYQQRPTPSDGGTFKREWFRRNLRREPGVRGHMLRGVKVETYKLTRALAWAPLAEEGKVILVRNGQMENGQRTMENAGAVDNGKLKIGNAGQRERGHRRTENEPRLENEATIFHSPFSIVHWIDDFLDEVCAFPNARHDDQIDAVSLAVQMLKQRRFGAMGF